MMVGRLHAKHALSEEAKKAVEEFLAKNKVTKCLTVIAKGSEIPKRNRDGIFAKRRAEEGK